MQKGSSEGVRVSPTTQKFHAYYGARNINTVRTKARHLFLSWVNPVRTLSPYFCDTNSDVTFPSTSPATIQQILLENIRELTFIFQSINFKMSSTEWSVLRPLVILPASCATQFICLHITDFHFSNVNNYPKSRIQRRQGEYWLVLYLTGISDSIPGQSTVFPCK